MLERTVAELAQRFEMTWRISYRARRKRVAVFVSKLDHCLFDILIRHQSGAQQPQPCAGTMSFPGWMRCSCCRCWRHPFGRLDG